MKNYTIQSLSGKTKMTFIPDLGALGTSLLVTTGSGKERELLYFPKDWTPETHLKMCGGFPFMFPICGRLSRREGEARYLYRGKTYTMPIHGFAHRVPWELIDCKENRIAMRLCENELSLKEYPFSFELTLCYEVEEGRLRCHHTYHNTGNEPLPYYGGFHPYFRLPFQKDEILLSYHPKRQLIYNTSLTDIVGETSPFATPCPVSTPELNESLVELGLDKKVKLDFPDGSALSMQVTGESDPDFCPFVQLYHIPAEPFLCIEPWMSHPNAMNTTGAVRWLAPGAKDSGILELYYKD